MNKEEKEEAGTSGISRREFLKDAGLITGGAALGSIALAGACSASTTQTVTKTVTVTSPPITGVSEVSATANVVKLTVNEQDYELQVEAEDTLRDVLRNKIGIFSLKDMCNGYGACGSCTPLLTAGQFLLHGVGSAYDGQS
jgi:ferredoxin